MEKIDISLSCIRFLATKTLYAFLVLGLGKERSLSTRQEQVQAPVRIIVPHRSLASKRRIIDKSLKQQEIQNNDIS
jgi:hypothetical protein